MLFGGLSMGIKLFQQIGKGLHYLWSAATLGGSEVQQAEQEQQTAGRDEHTTTPRVVQYF